MLTASERKRNSVGHPVPSREQVLLDTFELGVTLLRLSLVMTVLLVPKTAIMQAALYQLIPHAYVRQNSEVAVVAE